MDREKYKKKINRLYKSHPIVALLGPRQCGKTTLSKQFVKALGKKKVNYFDLEDPNDLAKLENPKYILEALDGLIVIDEVQRRPDLFPILRVLVDKYPQKKFLILGSASRDLIQQSSETLAGRIAYIEVKPFDLLESKAPEKLWLRGGFPKSFLAKSEKDSDIWRREYVRTFLEQDIPALGLNISSKSMHRLWLMLTHFHGQTLNFSQLGKSLGISDVTVRHYIDILEGTFMIRTLTPWYENIKKRQLKTPKFFFRDSGIFHHLSGIETRQDLLTNPKLGQSWEGFAIEEVIRLLDLAETECFFWGVHNQAELDLLVHKKGKRYGFEIKFTDAPKVTKSMKTAIEILNLENITIVYPGPDHYQLDEKILVSGLENTDLIVR